MMWRALARAPMETKMTNVSLPFPTFAFVVATRAALGVGIGLLLAGRLTETQRRRMGLSLVAIGAATTVPAAMAVLNNRSRPA
jgi:hypothetical protein